jgi:hypothetical protein
MTRADSIRVSFDNTASLTKAATRIRTASRWRISKVNRSSGEGKRTISREFGVTGALQGRRMEGIDAIR